MPIINPECAASDNPVPESPQVLYAQLSEAARAGVADVEQFQTLWRSPEMKAVWDYVGDEIKENGGTLLQPTGVWERDYGVLLEELVKEKREKDEQDGGVTERSKAQSMAANWRMDVETFLQKGVPGVRVVPDQHEASVTIALVKAGMFFQAQAISEPDISVPEWRVSNVGPQSKLKAKLEMAICDCLNSRPRKWDITYLLVSLIAGIIYPVLRYDTTRNFSQLHESLDMLMTITLGHDSFLCRCQTKTMRKVQQNDRRCSSAPGSPCLQIRPSPST